MAVGGRLEDERRVRLRAVLTYDLAALVALGLAYFWNARLWGLNEVFGVDFGPMLAHGVPVLLVLVGVGLVLRSVNNRMVARALSKGDGELEGDVVAASTHPYRGGPRQIRPRRGSRFGKLDGAIVLIGVVLAAFTWHRSLDTSAWTTGARPQIWKTAEGPLGDLIGLDCRMSNSFWSLEQGRRVWRACQWSEGADDIHGLGLMNVDSGESVLSWLFPAAYGRPEIVAVLPFEETKIGVVMRTESGELALAEADDSGWTIPPRIVDAGRFRAEALGLAFHAGKLSMAYRDGHGVVYTVYGESPPRRHPSQPCAALPCKVVAGWIHPKEAQKWCWLRVQAGAWSRVCDGGAARPVEAAPTRTVRVAASGLLVQRFATPIMRLHDDALVPLERPDGLDETADWVPAFVARDGELASAQVWKMSDKTCRRVGTRTICLEESPSDRLAVSEWTEAGRSVGQVLPLDPRCRPEGALIVPHADGFRMMLSDRCRLDVDARLHRSDPLSVEMHLRQRGSFRTDLDEPRHTWLLAFLRYGWLLTGALVFGLAQPLRRRGVYPILDRPVAVAAFVYVALGGLALRALLPLLS